MAILVSVAPPGGIARIARQRLCVSLQFYEGQEADSSRRVITVGESELLLNSLITAQEGERCRISGTAQLVDIDGNALGSIVMHAVILWVPAPPGARQVFGPPSLVPHSQADPGSAHSSPGKPTSTSLDRSSSPSRDRAPSPWGGAAASGGRSVPGRRLGAGRAASPPSHSAARKDLPRHGRRPGSREKRSKTASGNPSSDMSAPVSRSQPSLKLGGQGMSRSSSRERTSKAAGHVRGDRHTGALTGACESRSQSAQRRRGRECAESYAEGVSSDSAGALPVFVSLAEGW